ncbi:hypothetical protein Dimus_032758 [Dionaea muscipula]
MRSGESLKSNYLEFGSRCLTSTGTLWMRAERGDSSASSGRARFSFLQRKQKTSTAETLPTHRQPPPLTAPPPDAGWSQVQTLIQVSPDRFRADKASPTVAERGSDLSGGFPRQRSETSRNNKLTAMQEQWLGGTVEGRRKEGE